MFTIRHFSYLFFGILFLLNTTSLFGQSEKENYSLLWEISGNGLTSPGYVFGSMHVTEKEIFEFPDSLLIALSNCAAFANEVHLDSAMNLFLGELLKSDSFLNRSSKEEGDEGEESTAEDIVDEEMEEDNEMPTVLDAYLMNIAKLKNKKIYGLESLEDAMNQLDEEDYDLDFDRFFRTTPEYKNMLSIYRSGSLEDIESFVEGYGTAFEEDVELNKRNHIQAASIDRILQEHSLFSVVGAAHLGGKQGLIRLLREKGYRLRRVEAEFTQGLFDEEAFTQVQEPWVLQTDSPTTYAFKMPQPPQGIDISSLMEMYLGVDIGTGTFYYVFEGSAEGGGATDLISSLDTMAQNIMGADRTMLQRTVIDFEGVPGIEVLFYDRDNEMKYNRLRLLLRESSVIVMALGATTKAVLTSAIADYFFNSLELFEPANELKDSMDMKGAFRILLPEDVELRTQSKDDGEGNIYHINIYQGTLGDLTFLVRFNDLPRGLYQQSDSLLLNGFVEQMTSRYGKEPYALEEIEVEGYPGVDFRYEIEGVEARGILVVRGHRNYLLMGIGEQNELIDQFFDSFQFLPFPDPVMEKKTVVDNTLKMNFPADTIHQENELRMYNLSSEKKSFIIAGTDEQTGAVFMLESYEFSPFFQLDDPEGKDSFLLRLPEELFEQEVGDSLLYKKLIELEGGIQAVAFEYTKRKVNSRYRYLAFFRNNYSYVLHAYVPRELAEHPKVNAFFTDLELLEPEEDMRSLFYPKSKIVLENLLSPDSTVAAEALLGLRFWDFSTEELPLIYALLEDDSPQAADVELKTELINQFQYTSDEQTLPFIDRYFETTTDLTLRQAIFTNLLKMKKEESLDRLFRWAIAYPEVINTDFYLPLNAVLEDTLALFQQFYPEVKKVLDEGSLVNNFLLLAKNTLEDSLIDQSFVLNDLPFFYQLAEKYIGKTDYKDQLSQQYIIRFYEQLPTNETTVKQVQQMISTPSSSSWLRMEGLKYLAGRKQSLEAAWFTPLLQDSSYHYSTLVFLRDQQLTHFVDKKMYQHEEVAKAMFIELFYDYEEYYPQITNIKSKTIDYKGKAQKVYVVKYQFPGESEQYVGVAGPFPLKKKDLNFSSALLNWSYEVWTAEGEAAIVEGLVEE